MAYNIKTAVYIFLSILFCWNLNASNEEIVADCEVSEYASEGIEFFELPRDIMLVILENVCGYITDDELVVECHKNESNLTLVNYILGPYGRGKDTPAISCKGLPIYIFPYFKRDVTKMSLFSLSSGRFNFKKLSKTDIEYNELPRILSESNVETLELRYCDLCYSKDNAGFIFWISIDALKNIKELDLSNNQFESDEVGRLIKVLPHTQIRILILSGNFIKYDDARSLMIALLASNVESVDLTGNSFSNCEVNLLKRIFKLNTPEYFKAKKECERKYGPVIEKERKVYFN